MIYIAGSFPESPYTQEQIIRGIAYLLPVSRELIASTITSVAAARGAIGVLAIIGLIWGGTSFFTSIRASLNTAWGIRKPAPILKGQIIHLVISRLLTVNQDIPNCVMDKLIQSRFFKEFSMILKLFLTKHVQ